MSKIWVLFAFMLLLVSGTAARADDWSANFKTLDADGNGYITQGEYDANLTKLKLGESAPTFVVLDINNDNAIDPDEWARAEKIRNAYSKTSCQSSDSSWCPCLSHPEKPECQ